MEFLVTNVTGTGTRQVTVTATEATGVTATQRTGQPSEKTEKMVSATIGTSAVTGTAQSTTAETSTEVGTGCEDLFGRASTRWLRLHGWVDE